MGSRERRRRSRSRSRSRSPRRRRSRSRDGDRGGGGRRRRAASSRSRSRSRTRSSRSPAPSSHRANGGRGERQRERERERADRPRSGNAPPPLPRASASPSRRASGARPHPAGGSSYLGAAPPQTPGGAFSPGGAGEIPATVWPTEIAFRGAARLFSLEQLQTSPPTISADGVSPQAEAAARAEAVALLQEAGMRLRLSPLAIATAAAFLHRFFAVKSMARNCRALVAAAALYLAGKVEETPARAREVLAAVDSLVPLSYRIKRSEGGEGEEYGGWEEEEEEEEEGAEEVKEVVEGGEKGAKERLKTPRAQTWTPLAADEPAMLSAVDALMTAERALLYSLGFRLDVEHPYRTALSLVKEHGDAATVQGGGGPSSSSSSAAAATATDGDGAPAAAAPAAAARAPTTPPLPLAGPGAKVLAQTVWNLLTDSLRTRLCLTHRPQAVGAAAFLLALRLHGADVAASSTSSSSSTSSASLTSPSAAAAAAAPPPPSSSSKASSSSSALSPRWWWEGVGATPAEIGSAADELLKVYEEGGGGGGSGGKVEEERGLVNKEEEKK